MTSSPSAPGPTTPPPGTKRPQGGPSRGQLLVLCALALLIAPGALAGTALTVALWERRATPSARRLMAALGLVLFLALPTGSGWVWPVQAVGGTPPAAILAGIAAQALLGPLAVALARSRLSAPPPATTPETPAPAPAPGPPPARLAPLPLGADRAGRPVTLDLAGEASVLVVGLPGSGKTTTLVRLSGAALGLGWSVIVLDLKGSGLMNRAVHTLAARHGVPLSVFDRADPASLGYDPCAGDPAAVTNKLVGAFSYAGVANVYQQVALATLPQVIAALAAARTPLTLAAIVAALEPGALARLGREAGSAGGVDHERRLRDLQQSAEKTRVIAEGIVGLQQRLKALDLGVFGPLLRQTPALDWAAIAARPALAYVGLSALGAPADVELLGRVMAQELKQLADGRLHGGTTTPPILLVVDEFAALGEAEQLSDLILQSREAGIVTVASSQYLPKATPLRKALLGSGVIIAHRVEGDDAEVLASQFGTSPTVEMTPSVDFATGAATRGSVRRGRTYTVSPDQLREFGPGQVALRVVRQPLAERHTLMTISREEIDSWTPSGPTS